MLELALQIFFVSAYALQFKHIDKRLSAWNCSEKNRIVYAVYADIRICGYLHLYDYVVYILIRMKAHNQQLQGQLPFKVALYPQAIWYSS